MTPPVPQLSGTPPLRWYERLDLPALLTLVALALVVWSAPTLRGADREVDHLGNLARFLRRFLPPDLSVVPEVGLALLETGRIAVAATACGALLALPLAVLGARATAPAPMVVAVRILLAAIRTVPSLVWALMAVAVVGPTPLAGVVALALYSVSYLAKFGADAIDSTDLAALRALRAGGASRFQAVWHGLWPDLRPIAWSHALWMLEYNLRSGAIIGYVGAGGVGTLIVAYQEYGRWDQVATVLLALLVLVLVLDLVGDRLRAALLRRT